MPRKPVQLSLFWRTFLLLALLLAGGIAAWVGALQIVQADPRAQRSAQQVAALVSVMRSSLRMADAAERAALLKSIDAQQIMRVQARDAADRWEPYPPDRFGRTIGEELRSRLGPDAIIAGSLNGVPGLWIGFTTDKDRFWLQPTTPATTALTGPIGYLWIGLTLLATLVGSTMIARLINRPLRDLSFAASRVREGDLDSRLSETAFTSEIREVNRGFNRMARELARVEEDRAVMLAGISHDLRTPLSRLRLETEMSVSSEEARRNMVADIEQLDTIIAKFMDYARPGETHLQPVHVAQLIDREAAPFRDPAQIRIASRVARDLEVMADETELSRVFGNLFENARRYGRSNDTGIAVVSVSHARVDPWVIVSVRDQGPGVADDKLAQLTTPFFRGDAARTAASGAGLGLAIVEKSLQRMGGSLELANAADGGLIAHIRLKLAPAKTAA